MKTLIVTGACLLLLGYWWSKKRLPRRVYKKAGSLIGNTPIIEIASFTKLLPNVRVLAKCEYLNPGGSPKDRVAKAIIDEFEQGGAIKPHEGYTIYEGTVGSTGIALAWQARARGYRCVICMPDDVAVEKREILKRLGAEIVLVKPASIVDKEQFVNKAKSLAADDPKGVFADQFENPANYFGHFENTGPEIFEQTGGRIDYLVMGCGTGGTLAGCCRYLKPRIDGLRVILADPQGSGLCNKVNFGVFYNITESEGKRRRHQIDTIVEGVGINRMTRNLKPILEDNAVRWIDEAIRVTDREAVCMARYLALYEGIFVGSSSCVNLVAVVKKARLLTSSENEKVFLTLLNDSGQRWSDDYLVKIGLFKPGELESKGFFASLKDLSFISS